MAKQPITGKANKKAAAPIKVKQDMIDFIKEQGMTAALKRAGELKASGAKGEAEFLEGVRRMYGARRLSEATMAANPKKAAPKGAMVDGMKKPSATKSTKPVGKPGEYKSSMKGTGKGKGMSAKEKALAAVGGVAAVGTLIASRGKAAGLAAKLSPAIAKSGLGKALIGTGENVSRKALLASGKISAKTKGGVTQSQFDVMNAAAKAKGIKLPPVKAAAKAPVKKAAAPAKQAATPKPPVKVPSKKKIAVAAALTPGQKKGK